MGKNPLLSDEEVDVKLTTTTKKVSNNSLLSDEEVDISAPVKKKEPTENNLGSNDSSNGSEPSQSRDYFQRLPSEAASGANYTPVERAYILGTLETLNKPLFTNPKTQGRALQAYYDSLKANGVDMDKILNAVRKEREYHTDPLVQVATAPKQAYEAGAKALGEAYKETLPSSAMQTILEGAKNGDSNATTAANVAAKPLGKLLEGAINVTAATPQGAPFFTVIKQLETDPKLAAYTHAAMAPLTNLYGSEDDPEYKKVALNFLDALAGIGLFSVAHEAGAAPKELTTDQIKKAADIAATKTPEQLQVISDAMKTPEIAPDVIKLTDLETDIASTPEGHPAAEALKKQHEELSTAIDEKVNQLATTGAVDMADKSQVELLTNTRQQLIDQLPSASETGKEAIQKQITEIDKTLEKNASTIRSNERQVPKDGNESQGSQDQSGENIQQPQKAGAETSNGQERLNDLPDIVNPLSEKAQSIYDQTKQVFDSSTPEEQKLMIDKVKENIKTSEDADIVSAGERFIRDVETPISEEPPKPLADETKTVSGSGEDATIPESSPQPVSDANQPASDVFTELDQTNKPRTINERAAAKKAFKEKYPDVAEKAIEITKNFDKYIDKLKENGEITKIEC